MMASPQLKPSAVTDQGLLIGRLVEADIPFAHDVPMKRYNWFRTGGMADLFVEPTSEDQLATLLRCIPDDMPITIVGAGSNMLVRDGGIRGIVVRLGKFFGQINRSGNRLTAEAGVQDVHLARLAADEGLSGLEFLVGIPGTIGGALAMNAGAYGAEIADVFVSATAVGRDGSIHTLEKDDFTFAYRRSGLPTGMVITSVTLEGVSGEPEAINQRLEEIKAEREASQPIGVRTGGSTFKNPEGYKAWELADAAGCRGLTIGDAKLSEKHCNFMVNLGAATATDLELLGEEVRARVFKNNGISLDWEIQRVGSPHGSKEA